MVLSLAVISLAVMSVLLAREKSRAEAALERSEEYLMLALRAMAEFTQTANEELAGPRLAFDSCQ